MSGLNLQYKNQAQPSCFSNFLPPFGASKEHQEAHFVTGSINSTANTASLRGSMSSASSDNVSNLFRNKPLQVFKTNNHNNRQPQHLQLQQTQEKTKELDALLAQSMAELSFQERQEQQEVLHGVASKVEEDETKIESWLQELDESLQQRIAKSPGDSKLGAYKRAHETNPGYVKNRELRVMFLRGNEYNPESAADQMIRFFSVKEGLFGKDKLCKDITLEDMDNDDKTAIASGVLQIVGHDQAGRQILLEFTALRSECPTTQSELRARFYIFLHVLKNNPSAQIKGIVIVIYGVDEFQDQSGGKGFVENTSMALSLPIQYSGLHLCISNPAQYVVCHGALRLAPAKMRARFKVHFGSHLECQYLLSTYGIPVENLPLMPRTNEARMDYHWQWYRECFMKECSTTAEEGHPHLPKFLWNLPYIPRPADVMFHRKKSNNGGNQRLRALTRHLLQAYNNGNKGVKRELVDYMMKDIANNGGRFLKQDGSERQQRLSVDANKIVWTLANESEIREKISQMFRNHRRPNVQQQQQQELQQHQQGTPFSGALNHPSQFQTDGAGAMETFPSPSPPTSPSPTIPQDALLHDQHNDADVLFGRKRNNAGNKLVRKMVAELSNEYEAANRTRKLEITNAIIDQVHALGGRFLRKTESERWEEVGTDFARAKISKHFRNHRRPQKPKQPPTSSSGGVAIVGASRNSSGGTVGLHV